MLTVIIPVYSLDQERKRNLEFVYNRLVSFNFKLIIGIQLKNIDEDLEYFNKFDKAEIKSFYENKYKFFNKGFIFNSCLKSVDTDFVMLLDADVYLPFSNLRDQIEVTDEIIKPFSECIYLSEQITQDFISKRKAEAPPELKRVSALGGGAIIIKTDLITKNNLWFDENFSGWGWEDIDFGDLIRFNSLKIKTLDQVAVHLYHKPSANINNASYYNSKDKLKSYIVHVFSPNQDSKDVLDSYLKHKTNDILLMNCCDVDHLNNDNLKFSFVPKEYNTYSLNKIIECALPFLQDEGWVLYTDSNYLINEYVYSDLISFDGDFYELYGFHDAKENFVNAQKNISGFAVRKKIWKQKNIPNLLINSSYWASSITSLFSNHKKKILRNQIKGLRQFSENTESSKINRKSLFKIIGNFKKNNYDISLVTPTGGRPKCIERCKNFIKRNKTNLKIQWIVINDFDDEEFDFATDMIYSKNLGSSSQNPLGQNIKEIAKYINSDFVLFIEDDDWYSEDYIDYYYKNLQKYSLFGQAFAKYYNIKNKTYELRTNSDTASLCQTGIRTELLLDNLNCFDDVYAPYNDMVLWTISANKYLDFNSTKCIGIKGSPGRKAIGYGHKSLKFKDSGCHVLNSWIGEDYKIYFPNIEIKDKTNYKKIHTNVTNEKFYDSKSLLYFSPFAPDFDMSSGGDRLLKILEILKLDLGFDVHFMCNAFRDEAHLKVLRNMGIKCYLPEGNEYLIGHIRKLKEKNDFSYVIFSWYDIANQYVNIIRNEFPNIKIVIDTVDIHWKRELRGVEQGFLSFDDKTLKERKKQELEVYENADVIFAVTHDDKQDLIEELGYCNFKILSNIHDQVEQCELGYGIGFIGNFAHPPNIDAALYSIEIFDQFVNTSQYKNLAIKPKLYIAGANMPEEISLKSNDNCVILGQIKDLKEFYKKINVSMSPLKWGSGIKGKICDAASRGALILTSDVGNEGIDLIDGTSGFIANSKEDFVEKLCFIYSNNCEKISISGKNLIDGLVSRKAAISVLGGTLQAKPITIVIVTYNKADDVKRCVTSILDKTEYPNYKILITDNASTDETQVVMQKLERENPTKIEYIRSETNDFFLIPNNKIMIDSKYKDSDICLINDDMEIVSKCWLSHFYSAAYSEHCICSVGGKILHPNNRLSEAGSELYSDGTGRNIGRGADPEDNAFNYPRYAGYVSGCFMYMRRDAIEKIGIFDEDFAPMYYEDSEWQYRAHLVGLKTIYEPKAVAIHHEGTDDSKPMKIHQENNRTKFVNKYKDKNIEQYNV